MSGAVTGAVDRRARDPPGRAATRRQRSPPSAMPAPATPSAQAPASTAATTPVRTSPDPAVPRSAVPSVSTNAVPSGSTMTVPGPLRTMTAPSAEAAARAASSRAAGGEQAGLHPLELALMRSEDGGAGPATPGRRSRARTSASSATTVRAPASRTTGTRASSTARTATASAASPTKPGPARPGGGADLLGRRLAVDHHVGVARPRPRTRSRRRGRGSGPCRRCACRAACVDEEGGTGVRARSRAHPHHAAAVLVRVLRRAPAPRRPRRRPRGPRRRDRRRSPARCRSSCDGPAVVAARRDEQSRLHSPEGHRDVSADGRPATRPCRHRRRWAGRPRRRWRPRRQRLPRRGGGVRSQPARSPMPEDAVHDEVGVRDQRAHGVVGVRPACRRPPARRRASAPSAWTRSARHTASTRQPRRRQHGPCPEGVTAVVPRSTSSTHPGADDAPRALARSAGAR